MDKGDKLIEKDDFMHAAHTTYRSNGTCVTHSVTEFIVYS